MDEGDNIQIQIPMDLNDTFGELNASNLLNLDDGADTDPDSDSDPDLDDGVEADADADADADTDTDEIVICDDDTPLALCDGEEPRIGMVFKSDEAAKEFYTAYATRMCFSVRMNKSRRSRKDDTIIMRRFVCTKEGFHSKRVIYDDGKKKRKRSTAREGCMAMIEVVKKELPPPSHPYFHSKWVVTKLVTEHTHFLPTSQSQNQTLTKGESSNPNHTINNTNNEITLVNNKNRAIRTNPFGEEGEGPSLLEYLKQKQAQNPGFFYAVQVDNNSCMTNVFWADSNSRKSYRHFCDAIIFDTTYKKTKYMMPFACFKGVNHHLQSIHFGSCLLMDETKGSYIWLFETWLACMGGSHPFVLVTDNDKAMEGAIARVFPNTHHRFCQDHILSRCKHKLSDAYLKHPNLKTDLKSCVNGSGTIEEFTTRWEYLLQKYNMWENTWLQTVYQIRDKWANVYQKGLFFFPHLFLSLRDESLNKFFKRNFNTKISLMVFINCFDQDMGLRREKEARADFETIHFKPHLKTPSLIEKQAADLYTREIFDIFQEEFIQSLGFYIAKVESENNSKITKYSLGREEEVEGEESQNQMHVVSITQPNNCASCNCGKFEHSGILCRHVMKVFLIVGVRNLPQEYVLKRWTKIANVGLNERDGFVAEEEREDSESMVRWYNDLCKDGVRLGMEGGVEKEVYNVAKNALRNAFTDVVVEMNRVKGQNGNCRVGGGGRLQKTVKLPLSKLQPKKPILQRPQQLDDDGGGQESSRM